MDNNYSSEKINNNLALLKELTSSKEVGNYTLKKLISISCKYAISYLCTKYAKDRIKFLNLGFTFEDIANDSIIPLLLKNSKTKEIGIVKSYKDWKAPINTDAQAQYFFYRIITNRVDQEVTKILRDADPFFSKILNAVNYVIEKNNWQKITYCGSVYIANKNMGTNKKFMNHDEFDAIPPKLFFGNMTKVITNIFTHLKNEPELYSAIPLNQLIKKIKFSHMNSFVDIPSSSGFDNEEKLDIEVITANCLMIVFQRLDEFYFKKGKITLDEKKILAKVLTELARDLKNGGQSRGLYLYMKDHIPNLTNEMFYQKYHQILDYLFRQLKTEIVSNLEVRI
ncbi:MAG: hypothetical protein FJ214_05240 [Ignavibacteria bacterium]|nr:hypothetical protein [Ignavibacteria bacterium]